jgi:hypothetical protein
MSAGDVLDRGLKLLMARFPLIFAIDLIVLSPLLFLQLTNPLFIEGNGSLEFVLIFLGLSLLTLLVTIILAPIGAAAVVHVVMQEYVGEPVSLGSAFAYALTRFLSLLGTSLLAGLLIAVGCMAFCIPGIYLYVCWLLISQVVVLENQGGMDAMNRSMELTKNFWWRSFGICVLIAVGGRILSFATSIGLGLVLPYEETIPVKGAFPITKIVNYPNYAINVLVSTLIGMVAQSYLAVCTTLVYLDLRIRKEGLDLEMAALERPAKPAE